jgi:hypothetical protein
MWPWPSHCPPLGLVPICGVRCKVTVELVRLFFTWRPWSLSCNIYLTPSPSLASQAHLVLTVPVMGLSTLNKCLKSSPVVWALLRPHLTDRSGA